MVYSKIQDVTSCLVADTGDPDETVVEPGYIIGNLPKPWLDLPHPVVVMVTDGENKVEYTLETFISKTYKVKNDQVRIGPHRMQLQGLVIHVGVKIVLENISPLEEKELD